MGGPSPSILRHGGRRRIRRLIHHANKYRGPHAGPIPTLTHPSPAMNNATATPCRLLTPCQHLYTFEITPSAEIRMEVEHLPQAHVTISYMAPPDWLQLITRLIDAGAKKI